MLIFRGVRLIETKDVSPLWRWDLLGPFGFALNAESVFFKAANLLGPPSMHHKDIAEQKKRSKKNGWAVKKQRAFNEWSYKRFLQQNDLELGSLASRILTCFRSEVNYLKIHPSRPHCFEKAVCYSESATNLVLDISRILDPRYSWMLWYFRNPSFSISLMNRINHLASGSSLENLQDVFIP